jgi:hypothetical protein
MNAFSNVMSMGIKRGSAAGTAYEVTLTLTKVTYGDRPFEVVKTAWSQGGLILSERGRRLFKHQDKAEAYFRRLMQEEDFVPIDVDEWLK